MILRRKSRKKAKVVKNDSRTYLNSLYPLNKDTVKKGDDTFDDGAGGLWKHKNV
jgi:hypothetical protein